MTWSGSAKIVDLAEACMISGFSTGTSGPDDGGSCVVEDGGDLTVWQLVSFWCLIRVDLWDSLLLPATRSCSVHFASSLYPVALLRHHEQHRECMGRGLQSSCGSTRKESFVWCVGFFQVSSWLKSTASSNPKGHVFPLALTLERDVFQMVISSAL